MLEYVGMGLVALALGGNIKKYMDVFKSKERKEQEMQIMIEKLNGDKSVSEATKNGMTKFMAVGTTMMTALIYGFLASLTGIWWMYILAGLISAFTCHNVYNLMKSLEAGKPKFSFTHRLVVPLDTIFIIAFFLLIFVV